jgi:CRP-like cAMP-binding protein
VVPEEFDTMAQTYRVLSELDPQQSRKLLPPAEDRKFGGGQIIFREGDKSSFFHFIVSGEVALEEAAGSQPVQVQTLHPGDAMGWSALSEDTQTHFQARALSPVSTVALPGERIREAAFSRRTQRVSGLRTGPGPAVRGGKPLRGAHCQPQ